MNEYYIVLPNVNLAFNVDFTGQTLKLIRKDIYDINGYYCLEQPKFDNNGKPCFGVVCISEEYLRYELP